MKSPAGGVNRSRRALLRASVASALAGPFVATRSKGIESQADTLVVGAGTAGLMAALHAARAGLRVQVLEKTTQTGGTLWFSGGQMSGANTARARQEGIVDTPEAHLADVMRLGERQADRLLVGLAVRNAAATIDWFDHKRVQWRDGHPVVATGHEPYSARRVFAPVNAGRALLAVIHEELATWSGSIDIKTGTEAVELITDRGGNIRGVVGMDAGGRRKEFRAKRVLLTSGGANGNDEVFRQFNPVPQFRKPWWPSNTGRGHAMAIAVGAYARGQESYLPDIGSVPATRSWPAPSIASAVHHPQRRPPWEIYVGASGQRFMREDNPSIDAREKAVAALPLHRYWSIFDTRILETAPPFLLAASRPLTPDAVRKLARQIDTVQAADSLPGLAKMCSIPVPMLLSTISQYNRAVNAKYDVLGRVHLPLPIDKPPFYAVLHQGASLLSFGGIAVDGELRVVRRDGSAIPGLYAGGEILGAGALMGRGYSSGMMVTPALTFGRLLGSRATAVGS
ncbi:MAG: FAD-dependent oxidoreductase [Steroidobacteraceae bacterium]